MDYLVAIPVYNEAEHLADVLRRTLAVASRVLVVDDGSTDGIADVLSGFPEVRVARHPSNRGYGAALMTAFEYAIRMEVERVVTLDSDGQHDPALAPLFAADLHQCDIVSGSRYLKAFAEDTPAPPARRRINSLVTDELNACFKLELTDAFCGLKAYRTAALRRLRLTEEGYGMPLELWVQAACLNLRIRERAVPRVYLDPKRSFGEKLDDPAARLAYYQQVIDHAMAVARRRCGGCGGRLSHPVFARAGG